MFVTDNPPATIRRESARAAVVFLGFAPPEDESADAGFFNTVDTLLGDLPRVAMVNNAGGVALES